MTTAVSANEAKNRFGALLRRVDEGDEVIVESHGKPKAALISYEAFQEVQELREQQRRRDALERLRRLGERAAARNQDLTEEQAIALAVEVGREVNAGLAARASRSAARDPR